MLRLAFRNLFQGKVRVLISVGGVALALMLILALDAIFSGAEGQVTAYIDNSGADIFVAQEGVRNMHMASSSLPARVSERVKAVPGVESATPILYVTNMVVVGAERNLAYIIGLPDEARIGGAWQIVEGAPAYAPKAKEAIIDRGVAAKSGVTLGIKVKIMGEEFTVSGLSQGTANLTNSVAFIAMSDFSRLRGDSSTISFLLVKVEPGESPAAVATRIEVRVKNVTALPRTAFAEGERKVIRDMGTDIVAIMNLVGFFIGLAVMALMVYTATLSRRAEYGVLKALGASNGHLYRSVLAQAMISVGLGLALGIAVTLLLAAVVPYLGLNLALAVSGESLVKVAGVSLVIAGLSAVLPIKQIAGLDPATVFRGR
ncbi:MAG: ABC transporter permease [Chloroflexota bacterium]|nr:ABC transporter permease [Chloroflexota bacterium]